MLKALQTPVCIIYLRADQSVRQLIYALVMIVHSVIVRAENTPEGGRFPDIHLAQDLHVPVDLLAQRASQRHVDNLAATADSQNRLFCLNKGSDSFHLEPVLFGVQIPRRRIGLSVKGGIDILSARYYQRIVITH